MKQITNPVAFNLTFFPPQRRTGRMSRVILPANGAADSRLRESTAVNKTKEGRTSVGFILVLIHLYFSRIHFCRVVSVSRDDAKYKAKQKLVAKPSFDSRHPAASTPLTGWHIRWNFQIRQRTYARTRGTRSREASRRACRVVWANRAFLNRSCRWRRRGIQGRDAAQHLLFRQVLRR